MINYFTIIGSQGVKGDTVRKCYCMAKTFFATIDKQILVSHRIQRRLFFFLKLVKTTRLGVNMSVNLSSKEMLSCKGEASTSSISLAALKRFSYKTLSTPATTAFKAGETILSTANETYCECFQFCLSQSHQLRDQFIHKHSKWFSEELNRASDINLNRQKNRQSFCCGINKKFSVEVHSLKLLLEQFSCVTVITVRIWCL